MTSKRLEMQRKKITNTENTSQANDTSYNNRNNSDLFFQKGKTGNVERSQIYLFDQKYPNRSGNLGQGEPGETSHKTPLENSDSERHDDQLMREYIENHPLQQQIDEGNRKLKDNKDFFQFVPNIIKEAKERISKSMEHLEALKQKGETTYDQITYQTKHDLEIRLTVLRQLQNKTKVELNELSTISRPINFSSLQSEIQSMNDSDAKKVLEEHFNELYIAWREQNPTKNHLIEQIKPWIDKIDSYIEKIERILQTGPENYHQSEGSNDDSITRAKRELAKYASGHVKALNESLDYIDNHPIQQLLDKEHGKVQKNREIFESASDTRERVDELVSQIEASASKVKTLFDLINSIPTLQDDLATLRQLKNRTKAELKQLYTISHPIDRHDSLQLEIQSITDSTAKKKLHEHLQEHYSIWEENISNKDLFIDKSKDTLDIIDKFIAETEATMQEATKKQRQLDERLDLYSESPRQKLANAQENLEANKKLLDDAEETFKGVDTLLSWELNDHIGKKIESWNEAHPEAPEEKRNAVYYRTNSYERQTIELQDQLVTLDKTQKELNGKLAEISDIRSPEEFLDGLRPEILILDYRTLIDDFLHDLDVLNSFWHDDIEPRKIHLVEKAHSQIDRVNESIKEINALLQSEMPEAIDLRKEN